MNIIRVRRPLLYFVVAIMFCMMLLVPFSSAMAVDFTITITLSQAAHGSSIPIRVAVDTSPETQAFTRFTVNIYRNGSLVDTLGWQDSEGRDVVGISTTFTSNFTLTNALPSEQILSFDCFVYNSGGAQVASGSASKEPPVTHSYETLANTPATCTEPGYSNQRCTFCGYAIKTAIPGEPALGHDYGWSTYTHDDTTSGSGSMHYRLCLRQGCGYKELSSCTFGKPFTEPATCTQAERLRYICSVCNYSYFTESGSPLGHDFQRDAARDVAATCTAPGLEAYTCIRTHCGEHDDITVTALGHDYVAVVTNPTCLADGYTTFTCSRSLCGDTYTGDATAALGHDFQRDTARDVSATCTAPGLEANSCSRCPEHNDTVIAVLGHDYIAVVTNPTCTAGGYTTYTCSRSLCGDTYIGDSAASLNHRLGEWIPQGNGTHAAECIRTGCTYEKAAQCSPQHSLLYGEEFVFCPVCGETSTGERLSLIDSASAQPITKTLPRGELIVRSGTLPNGAVLIIVAFEHAGNLQQPQGNVRFTLPAEAFAGYSLTRTNPDGSVVNVPFHISKDALTFELDFTPSEGSILSPAIVIQLTPIQ